MSTVTSQPAVIPNIPAEIKSQIIAAVEAKWPEAEVGTTYFPEVVGIQGVPSIDVFQAAKEKDIAVVADDIMSEMIQAGEWDPTTKGIVPTTGKIIERVKNSSYAEDLGWDIVQTIPTDLPALCDMKIGQVWTVWASYPVGPAGLWGEELPESKVVSKGALLGVGVIEMDHKPEFITILRPTSVEEAQNGVDIVGTWPAILEGEVLFEDVRPTYATDLMGIRLLFDLVTEGNLYLEEPIWPLALENWAFKHEFLNIVPASDKWAHGKTIGAVWLSDGDGGRTWQQVCGSQQ
jgi:hypothetical protein